MHLWLILLPQLAMLEHRRELLYLKLRVLSCLELSDLLHQQYSYINADGAMIGFLLQRLAPMQMGSSMSAVGLAM